MSDLPWRDPLITLAAMPTRVRFTGKGGWQIERERASRELAVGEVYVIERLDIGRSSSTVSIATEGGKFVGQYNAAMFDFLAFGLDADDDPAPAAAGRDTKENQP